MIPLPQVYSIYLYATYGLHIVAYAMLTPIQAGEMKQKWTRHEQ